MYTRYFVFGLLLSIILEHTNQYIIEGVDNISSHTLRPSEIDTKLENHDYGINIANIGAINDELKKHNDALEQLVEISLLNEKKIKELLENLKPTTDTNDVVEDIKNTRRSENSGHVEKIYRPQDVFRRMGTLLPRYGQLLKSIIIDNIGDVANPKVMVEDDPDENDEVTTSKDENEITSPPFKTRRFEGNIQLPSQTVSDSEGKRNPWCEVASVCKKNMNKICGYDEKIGLGEFDDLCHMFEANCHWNFNFTPISNCEQG